MSMVPMSFPGWWDGSWWNGFDQRSEIFNERIFYPPMLPPMPMRPLLFPRPWTNLGPMPFKTGLTIANKDDLQISLDVQLFSPSEITVQTVDNTVIVEAKHKEKPDEHGFVSRHFMRRYVLPSGHDPKDVVSSLSFDGVLTITAPRKAPPPPNPAKVRTIPITQTGENSK
ncbi:protein lethal(2)essential for life-like [Malaya genurostris]|uniref:protein lethal(2)essential for life-like n=1 Tax=Malaya genurostris TaxID=325434 RepID=UPI0026F3A083|nr:protein lethal(2)essential for life-like [Malaya genurostris]